MDKHIIGCDAGLSRIEEFAGCNGAGSAFQIGILADDGGRFAAQFQRHRREVLCGGGHDLAPDSGGSGKEEMVERQRRKLRRQGRVAKRHRHPILRKHIGEKAFEKRRSAWRVLGWFEENVVSSRNGSNKWRQRQIDRIVPRSDNAYHAQWNITDFSLGGPHFPARLAPLWLHPSLEMVERIVDFRKDDVCFREQGFVL